MESGTRTPARPSGSTGLAAAFCGVAALLLGMASTDPAAAAVQSQDEPGMVRVTVEVELSCPSCAQGLERRLGRLEHVAGVEVLPADGRIVLSVEPGRRLDLAAVRDTVRNAGFLPDAVAVIAVGHLTDVGGAPALALSPDFALPLATGPATAALATEAGGRLLRVRGHWHDPAVGPGRLQVESFQTR